MNSFTLLGSIKCKINKLIPKGKFTRGAAIIVAGTVIGQGIVILSSPIITRLYTPEEFGVLAVYGAIISFLTLIATLRYELAILLPADDRSALNVLVLSLLVLTVMCLLIITMLYFFGDSILQLTNTPSIGLFLWVLPLGIFLGGANNIFNYWALRHKEYVLVSRTRVQKGGGMAGTQMLFGYLQLGVFGLILGHIIGFTAGLFSLVKFSLKSIVGYLGSLSWKKIWYFSYRYRKFPLYSTWSDMANVAGTQLPLIIFSLLFNPHVAGLYMLAHRVANAPAALVSEGIGKAFMSSAVGAIQNGSLDELALEIYSMLLRIGLAPTIILGIIAPEFFTIVFGSEWVEAGYYLQWMIPWLAAVFLFVPTLTLFSILEIQQYDLIFQVSLLTLRIGSLFLGAYLGGVIMAIALYSITASIVYIIFGFFALNKAGVRYLELLKKLVIELIVIFPFAVLIKLTVYMTNYLAMEFWVKNTILVMVISLIFIILSKRIKPAFQRIRKIEID